MATGLAYHYTDQGGFEGIVANKILRASDARTMNDKQEVRWTRTLVERILSHWLDVPQFLSINVRLFLERGPEVYLTCFSTEVDLLSQWVRYAEDGAGFAIGFEPELIAKRGIPPDPHRRQDGEMCEGMFPVAYDREQQQQTLTQLIERALPGCRSADHDARDRAMAFLLGGIGVFPPFFKHPGFREECEIRYIRHHRRIESVMGEPDDLTKSLKTRTRPDGEVVRYFEKPFPPEAIKEVWIGPTSTQRQGDIEHFLVKSGVTGAEVKVSDIPYRHIPKAACAEKS